MAKGALDSTHTVVVKSENRGIRVVIGLLALILWFRWWWTGNLFFAVAYAMPPAETDGEFQSITGALLPIFVDLLWFIGSVIIWLLAHSWAAIWDVISGVIETLQYYSARRAAVDAAQKAATEAGTKAGNTNAGAIASTAAVDAAGKTADAAVGGSEPPRPNKLNVDKLKRLLDDHNNKLAAADQGFARVNARMDELAARVESLADGSRANETFLAERQTKLEQTAATHADLAALAELVGQLLTRIEALESIRDLSASEPDKPPKPAYRRVTRQTPVRRSTSKKAR